MSYALLSYAAGGGARAGLAVDRRMVDLAAATGVPADSSLAAVLEDWVQAERRCEAVARGLASGTFQPAAVPLEQLRLCAPLVPGEIFCAGANYQDHVEAMARVMQQPVGPNFKQVGEDPWHFVKPARSSVVGPGAVVTMPAYSTRVDYEIELAAVVGRAARDVPVDRALDFVAGYTIANDLSVREVGRKRTPAGSPFHYDWITMKGFEGSCPLGPWIVPASAIPDPQALALKLWVNDELRQDSNTSQMIFSVAEQLAWLSSRLTLQPGDVILTGTPAGVGMERQQFLKAGDTVRLWIDRIGELSHRMA